MNDLISREDVLDILNDRLHSKCDYSVYCDIFNEVEDLPSASQWIPCSERLPSENICALVCLPNGSIEIDAWTCGEWLINDAKITLSPIAWMPLPEPYKEKTE